MLRAAVAITVALALVASHWQAYTLGAEKAQAAWDTQKLDVARQTLRLIEARDRASQELQDAATAQRRAKNAQIASLDADLAAALSRLSDRADRPSGADLPQAASTGAGERCTGAELYRADAEFLSREAARAERLVGELAECQAAYDRAVRALN